MRDVRRASDRACDRSIARAADPAVPGLGNTVRSHPATRSDLNAAEQQNIARATVWVGGRRWGLSDIDALWLKDLHRRMFDDTRRWAGTFRRSGSNIGVPWPEIPTAVEGLIRDVRVQVEGGVWFAHSSGDRGVGASAWWISSVYFIGFPHLSMVAS